AGIADDAVERGAGQRADGIQAHIAPQLQPDVPADIVAHGRVESRRGQGLAEREHPARAAAIGLANDETVEIVMRDHPRRDDLTGRLDHAPYGAMRLQRMPLPAARVHRLEMTPLE